MRRAVLRVVEVGLLVPAFGLLIPPIPSEPGAPSGPLLPVLVYAAGCFLVSLGLACHRGGERWPVALVKLVLFCAFGWLIHERMGY